jgi:hypothetical protein
MTIEYDRLRLLWPDHLGLARGKYLTPEKAASGTAHCITLFTLGFDREIIPHDGGLFWDGLSVETLDCIERASTDIVTPASLREALDALEADTDLVEAFGAAFVDGFVTVKRAEWDRYQKWTTDWEMSEYLPFL